MIATRAWVLNKEPNNQGFSNHRERGRRNLVAYLRCNQLTLRCVAFMIPSGREIPTLILGHVLLLAYKSAAPGHTHLDSRN
jgi:hypothetical protein